MESPDPEPEQDLSVKSQHLGARRQELAARSATTQPADSNVLSILSILLLNHINRRILCLKALRFSFGIIANVHL